MTIIATRLGQSKEDWIAEHLDNLYQQFGLGLEKARAEMGREEDIDEAEMSPSITKNISPDQNWIETGYD